MKPSGESEVVESQACGKGHHSNFLRSHTNVGLGVGMEASKFDLKEQHASDKFQKAILEYLSAISSIGRFVNAIVIALAVLTPVSHRVGSRHRPVTYNISSDRRPTGESFCSSSIRPKLLFLPRSSGGYAPGSNTRYTGRRFGVGTEGSDKG